MASILSTMAQLSHPDAALTIRGIPARPSPNLPSITSTIASLVVSIMIRGDAVGGQRVGELWSCLTLPNLRTLTVDPGISPGSRPLYWPSNQFKPLAARSSFHNTLRVLRISRVFITEDELTRALEYLGSRERLEISDQPSHLLIKDFLLQRLTQDSGPDACLIPNLRYLYCAMFFRFTEEVYIDLILLRVGSFGGEPFHAVVHDLWNGEDDRFDFAELVNSVDPERLRFQLT
ncbi:hypothetical protein FB45DRAFT_1067476 [Roridomyces roridus]|uniref:Uncharacterized protein n=1 Tax=Roridomyces roridus TaxID=1738132 RepID=A0AAD7B2C6_9AGAR|nr:hypothetical protein FB45DRAFT_1067476 [Roridomyces roridus]